MKLYTAEEIVEDIWGYEGAKIELPTGMFTNTLYSTVNSRTSDKATIGDLNIKIRNYVNEYCIPKFDIPPDDTPDSFTLYSGSDKSCVFNKVGVMFNLYTKPFHDLLDKIPDEHGFFFVIDNNHNLVKFFSRIKH